MEVCDRAVPGFPVIEAVNRYGLCPVSVISPLSFELFNLYNACAGVSRMRSPAEYYALPNRYIEACRIIEDELKRVPKEMPSG